MKFGVCGGPDMARIAKEAGYDYFEWSVNGLLHPREEESIFEEALNQAKATGLPCPAVNVFIPGDLKITGPDVNRDALETFVSTALRRAEIAGVEAIVFGSGVARRVPDGFDRQTAWDQIVSFCKMMGPIAAFHHVTIVVEPLNVSETNIINTVGEGAELVRQVNYPFIRLLADGYHWAKDGDTVEGITKNASLLKHAHVATKEGRLPPNEDDTCAPFFAAMCQAGYDGRISIEGKIEAPTEELPRALEIMKKLTA